MKYCASFMKIFERINFLHKFFNCYLTEYKTVFRLTKHIDRPWLDKFKDTKDVTRNRKSKDRQTIQ